MFFGSFIKFIRGLFSRKPQKEVSYSVPPEVLKVAKDAGIAIDDITKTYRWFATAGNSPTYTWDITYGVPKLKRIHGVTVIFNKHHKENYGSQELAAKELSNWFGKHVSRRTIYRTLKEKNGNLTVGDRTVIVKYMED